MIAHPPLGASPAEDVIADPYCQRPLLNFAGSVCTHASCEEDTPRVVRFVRHDLLEDDLVSDRPAVRP
ncbi:MAG: hypothetical protein ACSLE6_17025 [Mycobacterium sp.]